MSCGVGDARLLRYLLENSRHPTKVGELRRNLVLSEFLEPRDDAESSWAVETRKLRRARSSEHHRKQWLKHREIRSYIDAHPEIIERLRREGKV